MRDHQFVLAASLSFLVPPKSARAVPQNLVRIRPLSGEHITYSTSGVYGPMFDGSFMYKAGDALPT